MGPKNKNQGKRPERSDGEGVRKARETGFLSGGARGKIVAAEPLILLRKKSRLTCLDKSRNHTHKFSCNLESSYFSTPS